MRKTLMYRQGDVLLVQASLPDGACQQAARDGDGKLVLAYGEATGHHHAIAESGADMLEFADGTRYLRVGAPVCLRHAEHHALPLAAGVYKIVIQREYVPGPIASRAVAD
jgi:hypothetical protein